MRIAMVSEHASPLAAVGGVDAGGQNVHVAALSAALAQRGHDVTVFTRRDDPDLPTRVASPQGYLVEHVPAGPATSVPKDALLPYMPEFGRYLAGRCDDFDLVHAHFWMSGLAAAETALPLALTFHALGSVKRRHQGAQDTSPPERVEIERYLAERAALVIATCTDEVRELRALGAAPERVAVVPCGVDLSLFRPDGPVRPPRRYRHRLVVAGRLVPRKGTDDVITALAELPETELLVAGGPGGTSFPLDPEVRRLTDLAGKMGVADRVRLLGQVPRTDMPALFRSADVVVATPWYEPFGMAPVEAMACGRPVVATAVGGMLDTVGERGAGLLVPPRDPQALAAAVRQLLADPERRQRYGRAARQGIERYGWPTIAARTEAAYAAMLATVMTGRR